MPPLSTYTIPDAIPENSAATPGLFNSRFSTMVASFQQLASDMSGFTNLPYLSTNSLYAESGQTINSFSTLSSTALAPNKVIGAPTWLATQTLNTSGNAATATLATLATLAVALQTSRSITISGDLSWTVNFDGSANVTAAGTLATVATAGTTGSSTAIPVITIDAKGRTTTITTAAVIAPAGTLTGTTLAANVVTSSLTTVGILASPHVTTLTVDSGGITVTSGTTALGANNLTMTGSIASSGSRVTKGWFTDLDVVNAVSASVTGNAATATTLQNTRTIWGQNFNGSANVSGALSGATTVSADTALILGTTPSTSGFVRLPSTGAITFRNAANNANLTLVESDASDHVLIDSQGKGTLFAGTLTATLSTNADFAHFINNANSGTAAESNLYIANAANTAAAAVALGCAGTGYTTAGGFIQDAGWVSSGTSLSGGLSIIARSGDVRMYAGGHTNLIGTWSATGLALEDSLKLYLDGSTHSNYIYNASGTMHLVTSGNVVQVDGSLVATGHVTTQANNTTANAANCHIDAVSGEHKVSTSSRLAKRDVTLVSVPDALRFVMAATPVTFRSAIKGDDPIRGHFGFILEDVRALDARFAYGASLAYERLIAPAFVVIQDHERRLKLLEVA